jgi:hypothetical protein
VNLYVHSGTFKAANGISGTTNDAEILRCLEAVSREVDDYCNRHFYTETGTRYFNTTTAERANVDDLLSVTSLYLDVLDDETWSEAWVEGTDFTLQPLDSFPKTRIHKKRGASKLFYNFPNALKVSGVFGYGDGTASPWASAGITGTVATTCGTTLTLSQASAVYAGQTVKLGTEQMYISAVSGTSATVERGINGTTAAIHSAVTIYVAQYPAQVTDTVVYLASGAFNLRMKRGLKDIMIGEYRETLVWDDRSRDAIPSMLGRLVRPTFCDV